MLSLEYKKKLDNSLSTLLLQLQQRLQKFCLLQPRQRDLQRPHNLQQLQHPPQSLIHRPTAATRQQLQNQLQECQILVDNPALLVSAQTEQEYALLQGKKIITY